MTQPTATTPLPRATPESHGIPSAAINAFIDAADKAGAELHSLMILRHGNVVAQGWWAPYTPDGIHLLYSLSKSFTSTGIGLAVGEGLLSLDDLVTSFFPEINAAELDEKVQRMQVRHVLAMASGHHDDTLEHIAFGADKNPVEEFLKLVPEEEPGTWFTYNNGCTLMLSAIITRLTGMRLVDYLTPRLFVPLGIEKTYWSAMGEISFGFSGLHARTDAIARLGQLYLQDGVWEGKQLLPVGWVEQASSVQVDNPREPNPDWCQGYGFQFWRARNNAYRGDGAYGQFCLVIPEHDVVFVTTSDSDDMQCILDAVWAELLPAFSPGPLAEAPADAAALANRLQGLRLPAVDGADTAVGATPRLAKAQADESPIRSLTLTDRADGARWQLAISDDAADYDVPCGFGEWASQEQLLVGSAPFATAACGAWSGDDTFTAELAMINTPHRVRIVCDFAAGTLEATWRTEPLGPSHPAELALWPN